MDINMNNVNFEKGKNENWFYLITDGSETLKADKSNGIKVFYDDGTFESNKETIEKYYEDYMKDLNNKGTLALYDYVLQDVDIVLSLFNAKSDAKDYRELAK